MTTVTEVRRRGGPTKGEQREAAILAATRELLNTRSVNDLTIDEIAKAAGVSRTSFYFYFPTKQAVVAALLGDLWEEFGHTYAWFDSVGPDRPGLREHHDAVARVWREHRSTLSCTTGLVDYEPLVEWADKAQRRFVEGLVAKIERDRLAGFIGLGIDDEPLARMIAELRNIQFRAISVLEGAAYEQALDDFTEVVLRMIYGSVS